MSKVCGDSQTLAYQGLVCGESQTLAMHYWEH